MDNESHEGQLLVLILDMNPHQNVFLRNPKDLTAWMDAILVFANTHLALHSANSLAALGSSGSHTFYLYPNETSEPLSAVDGQYATFYDVEKNIRNKVCDVLEKGLTSTYGVGSSLSGALAMGLTYIHRKRKDRVLGARILILSASGDSASQYMNFMNSFFTAQKLGLSIDACMLKSESPLLQQGAELTEGKYFSVSDVGGLLQFLLWIFLPNGKLREMMGLPSSPVVDYRAACFCHRQLVEIGYVCSVCLSIFCKFSPICTTCQTVFPVLHAKKKKTKN